MALAGAVLGGRYVLDQQIGTGGYSEVWHATDTVLVRPVAVKLLHPRHAGRSEGLVRFQAEARYAGALSHENIARVHDYGEPADGQPPYLVMELVNGPSLETVLASGPLDASRTLDIIAQAAAGLQAAHAAGLIHRDIKPANLLLAPGGIVKITDFGIAHTVSSAPITVTGELVGTPGYLAPERLSGEQATPASDLYALGMVAYECLAGAPPFTGPALVVALAHRDRPLPPLPPSVAPDVAEFVMQLTAKDPTWRPGRAADVAVRARWLNDGLTAGARGWSHPRSIPSRGQPQSVARLRRRIALACVSIAVAAVIGVVLASVIGFASPHPAAAPAHSRGSGVVAQPSARPSTSPARPPAGSLAARREPGSSAPVVAPVVAAARPGHKHGNGPGHGHGHGNGQDHGNGNGYGSGGVQTDSTSG
jgi:serine/threonine protein kinase